MPTTKPYLVLLLIMAFSSIAPAAPTSSQNVRAVPARTVPVRIQSSLAVRRDLGPPPAGVADLRFHDLFKTPVGDRGLEPGAKLVALDGKRVRVVGYMVRQQPEPVGRFLLSPLPADISDEDEPLADDLPANVITVNIPGAANQAVPLLPGLIQITGVLRIGAHVDSESGRVSWVQILLDPKPARALLGKDLQRAKVR